MMEAQCTCNSEYMVAVSTATTMATRRHSHSGAVLSSTDNVSHEANTVDSNSSSSISSCVVNESSTQTETESETMAQTVSTSTDETGSTEWQLQSTVVNTGSVNVNHEADTVDTSNISSCMVDESSTVTETETESETETEAMAQIVTESETETETETETMAQTVSMSTVTETESEAETVTETVTESETEMMAQIVSTSTVTETDVNVNLASDCTSAATVMMTSTDDETGGTEAGDLMRTDITTSQCSTDDARDDDDDVIIPTTQLQLQLDDDDDEPCQCHAADDSCTACSAVNSSTGNMQSSQENTSSAICDVTTPQAALPSYSASLARCQHHQTHAVTSSVTSSALRRRRKLCAECCLHCVVMATSLRFLLVGVVLLGAGCMAGGIALGAVNKQYDYFTWSAGLIGQSVLHLSYLLTY